MEEGGEAKEEEEDGKEGEGAGLWEEEGASHLPCCLIFVAMLSSGRCSPAVFCLFVCLFLKCFRC